MLGVAPLSACSPAAHATPACMEPQLIRVLPSAAQGVVSRHVPGGSVALVARGPTGTAHLQRGDGGG